jgi:hypothetical protein
MLGEDRIGMATIIDTHLPGCFALLNYSPPPPPLMNEKPKEGRAILATRTFRPPIPIEVTMRDNEITSIRDHGQITGEVRFSSGPWQVDAGWWRANPDVREYWDVEVDSGTYRVFRRGEWYADARYS